MGEKLNSNSREKIEQHQVSQPKKRVKNEKTVGVKAVLIGKHGCGKYNISRRFAFNYYAPDHVTTLKEWFSKTMKANEHHSLSYHVDLVYSDVFRINYRETYDEISDIYNLIRSIRKDQTPLLLVGNACDVEESERKVSKCEAEHLAEEWGIEYMEISAKTGENIDLMIDTLLGIYERLESEKQYERSKDYECCKCCLIL